MYTNLALIGVGKWGRHYLETMVRIPDVRIKTICALHVRSLEQFSSKYVKTTNYLDILKDPGIDGVIIATPAHTHSEICHKCIHHHKPVLLEKPMVTNYVDARTLVQTVTAHKSLVMIGQIYLFHPAFRLLKQEIKRVGQITQISTTAGNNGPFRQDLPALWDWTSHDIAMSLELVKSKPKQVSAWGLETNSIKPWLANTIYIKLKFANGIPVGIHVSRELLTRTRKLTVRGKLGALVFDDTQKNMLLFYKFTKSNGNSLTGQVLTPKDNVFSPLEKEIREFVDCLKYKRQPLTTVAKGATVIQIIAAAEESLKNKSHEIML